ncbi:MAG: PEP-CTERM sorting domain-containing protein [Acidobacteria bacterium]|nr:PEP-CTERM sorting domain-containing protein [Acidobacteriota bacterium]
MIKNVLVLMALVPVAALGTLIGDTVNVRYELGVFNSSDSVLVGTGVEIACPGGQNICSLLTVAGQSINIGARTIRYENSTNTGIFVGITPNGFRFDGLDSDPIVGVTLVTNIEDLDLFRVTHTPNSVQVEMRGLEISAGSYFEVGLLSLNDVPEPGTVWMGLLGMAALLRKVRKSS